MWYGLEHHFDKYILPHDYGDTIKAGDELKSMLCRFNRTKL